MNSLTIEAVWLRSFELSSLTLGITCVTLLPALLNETDNKVVSYTPVRDNRRPSKPPHSSRIATLVPEIAGYQPTATFS